MKKAICLWLISCSMAFGQALVTNSTTGLHVPAATNTTQGVVTVDNVTTFMNTPGVITAQGFTSDYSVPITSGAAAFSSNVSSKVNYLLLNANVTSSAMSTGAGATTPGWRWDLVVCQDATGGRTFTAPTTFVLGMAPMVAVISGAAANTCAEQSFVWSTTLASFVPYNYDLIGNASAITLGTLADARLSSNVPLLNVANTFSALNTFNDGLSIIDGSVSWKFVNGTTLLRGTDASGNIQTTFSTSGVASFGNDSSGVSGEVRIVPNTGMTGTNSSAGVEWSISNTSGAAQFNSLTVNQNITNAPGLQIATASGCTITAGAIGNNCQATITLPATEPDTAYKVAGCSIDTAVGGVATTGNISSKTTTTFSIGEVAMDTVTTGGGTINCTVVHN